jgi:hypothetical protein
MATPVDFQKPSHEISKNQQIRLKKENFVFYAHKSLSITKRGHESKIAFFSRF